MPEKGDCAATPIFRGAASPGNFYALELVGNFPAYHKILYGDASKLGIDFLVVLNVWKKVEITFWS